MNSWVLFIIYLHQKFNEYLESYLLNPVFVDNSVSQSASH